MQYKRITESDIGNLKDICSEERVYAGDAINEDYCHDEMAIYGKFKPEVVVEVLNTSEVSAVMRYAYENNIPVTPRGAGTGLCGGAVAIFGGILLSLTRMNRILEIDETNLTVTAEPGVLLMELSDAVSKKGLMYPPDPGEKSATIGGNVMTNAGGMRAVKYGVTKDYVRGMQVVLPNGDILDFGGKVKKSSSGYNLKDLLIGSEGTLGIATKLVLKLIPMPQKVLSLLVPYNDINDCIETVPKIILSGIELTTIEFMQKTVIEDAEKYLGKQFPDKSAEAYLILTFNSNTKNEIERMYDIVARICLESGAVDVLISDTDERQESIWSVRGAFLEAIKSSTSDMDECDVVVPISRIAEFVGYIGDLELKYELRIRSFGHAGDGNLHIYLCKDELSDEIWLEKLKIIMQCLYTKASELGGQVSGEHGIGHAKIPFLKESIGDISLNLMKSIKIAFDPKNILNPGKVVA
jgi:glycolate oxidase